MTNDPANTALEFLNRSARHVFLTGKAGTGKTTFLKNLSEKLSKPFIVVAPTGVAALNAGGVTIHSQFLFPLGAFLPEGNAVQFPEVNLFDSQSLYRRHPINAQRRKILQHIDLLVIDEISMVRADILDAIDQRLQTIRKQRRPFGGLQLLLIGDLYQLSPIVSDQEWSVLSKYYDGPHFFNSRALKASGFVQIELQKVYRQKDQSFIDLLNRLRYNELSNEDIDLLNERAKLTAPVDAIHLVTHRHQAAKINEQRLLAIDTSPFVYSAEISGDFAEHNYPVPQELMLKVGAQVMFVKNDNDGSAFYNGKLAEVLECQKDYIWVKMENHERFEVPLHTWKNARYKINEKKQEMEEELMGEFKQFPIRLAWAITIHKSQGLSFNKAQVDLGRAFAPGQAYVALTRLRSLSGLYLSSVVTRSAMIMDAAAKHFADAQKGVDVNSILEHSQKSYRYEHLNELFDWKRWHLAYRDFYQKNHHKLKFKTTGFENRFESFEKDLLTLIGLSVKFQREVYRLLEVNDLVTLNERILKSQNYFIPRLRKSIIDLLSLQMEYEQMTKTKALIENFEELIQVGFDFYVGLEKVDQTLAFLDGNTANSQQNTKDFRTKTWEGICKETPQPTLKRAKARAVLPKGETYKRTYDLVKAGLAPEAIAEKRNLKISTVFSHFRKGILEDEIAVEDILDSDQCEEMRLKLRKGHFDTLNQLVAAYPEYDLSTWSLFWRARLKK